MKDDLRNSVLAKALRLKHYELTNNNNISTHEYFDALALEVINTLDKYYGTARYWMAVEFERDRVLRELEATIDRIRNADIPR
jgi:hypothetical protein